MSSNKERILELEKTGKYVFHGSANGEIKELEPRQSTHVTDLSKPTESSINDGDPAVAATPYAQIAIYRAIVNSNNIHFKHTSGFGFSSPTNIYYRVDSEKTLQEIFNNKVGYVYIFNKADFKPYNRDRDPSEDEMEWRCYKPIKPVEVIKVTSNDLPPKNQIEITN